MIDVLIPFVCALYGFALGMTVVYMWFYLYEKKLHRKTIHRKTTVVIKRLPQSQSIRNGLYPGYIRDGNFTDKCSKCNQPFNGWLYEECPNCDSEEVGESSLQ